MHEINLKTYFGVIMKKINLMIVSLMVLILAIGSVYAGTDGGLLSDDDFDDEYEDDFELDDGEDENEYDEDDSDSDDLDDEDFDEDDSGSDDLDDEDESFEEEFNGDFDGEFTALSSSSDFSSEKGMDGGMASNSTGDYQNSMDLGPNAGNPIVILLLSLLFLIVIPLRNR